MSRALFLLALVAGIAHAQYFGGVSRISNSPDRIVVPTASVTTAVQPQSAEFAWGMYSLLYNYADTDGESVAIYGQAYKFGLAPTWAIVAEAQCPNGDGMGCFGAEVDVMASGNGPSLREGVQLVVGKARGAVAGPARIDSAIDIVAMGNVTPEVDLRHGIRFGLPCADSCLQIPAGSTINLGAGDPAASISFDAATGYMGLCNRRQGQWAWAVQMDTHQVVSGGPC